MMFPLQICSIVQFSGILTHFSSCNYGLVLASLVLKYKSLLAEVVHVLATFPPNFLVLAIEINIVFLTSFNIISHCFVVAQFGLLLAWVWYVVF